MSFVLGRTASLLARSLAARSTTLVARSAAGAGQRQLVMSATALLRASPATGPHAQSNALNTDFRRWLSFEKNDLDSDSDSDAVTEAGDDEDEGDSFFQATPTSARQTGQVKWFDSHRGFGFIAVPGGEDIFVHFTGVTGSGFRTLEENQTVEFSVGTGRRGPVAQNVVIIN